MARLRFGMDEHGKELLEMVSSADGESPSEGPGEGQAAARRPYKGENTIIMMEWERPYMRALVDALRVTDECDVLEIGFGCGYSATRIQEMGPRSHTIVEPDAAVLARLRGWAKGRQGVRIVEGFWQTVLPALGMFDAVFFDDFPLPATPDSSDLRGPVSRWHAFIDLCVAHHLPVGGRVTGYLARPLPLSRPGCKAAPLVPFQVEVPDNCPYFPYGEAYIPLVTRVAETAGAVGAGVESGIVGPLLPLMEDADHGERAAGSSRKKQKRLVLEALVRDSLGLDCEDG